MSRTHVHAPWHVVKEDPYFQARPWYRLCGCKTCTGQADRKHNQRVTRMRQRALLAELSQMSRQDVHDYDTHIPTPDRYALTWVSNWYPLKEQKPR
jgi:kynurenine formamidase